jgi:hypothetical protein
VCVCVCVIAAACSILCGSDGLSVRTVPDREVLLRVAMSAA